MESRRPPSCDSALNELAEPTVGLDGNGCGELKFSEANQALASLIMAFAIDVWSRAKLPGKKEELCAGRLCFEYEVTGRIEQ